MCTKLDQRAENGENPNEKRISSKGRLDLFGRLGQFHLLLVHYPAQFVLGNHLLAHFRRAGHREFRLVEKLCRNEGKC